jgi:hypothetical protein
MSSNRKAFVTMAFKRLDRNFEGSIKLDDIKGNFNAAQHPDVKMGKKTQDEVLYEFLETFEQHYALAVFFLLIFRIPIPETNS